MKLIVGLGNPGSEYTNTRHNVGFMVIDHLASIYKINVNKQKFNACYGEVMLNGEKILFLKPQSYMNLSGEAVKQFMKYYNLLPSDLFVIVDDLNLPCGKIRIRKSGTSGGHNGLKNIESNLGTDNYSRLRIGIDRAQNDDVKEYVLGKFSKSELETIENSIKLTDNIINDYVEYGIDYIMNKYNNN